MEYEWDPNKDAKNLQERGFGFEDAADALDKGPIIVWEDVRKDYGEHRMVACCHFQNDLITIVYGAGVAKAC